MFNNLRRRPTPARFFLYTCSLEVKGQDVWNRECVLEILYRGKEREREAEEAMNETSYEAATALVPKTYVTQGRDAKRTQEKQIQTLIQQRKLPSEGWNDTLIQLLLRELALMDSNNFPKNVGVGEREARIASGLVAQRHYHFGHGIGRSGDIAAVQPKAAGSSIMAQITNSMLLDVIRLAGVHAVQKCLLIPVATGMAMTLVLLTIRQERPDAKYVIWPRIDQKSCFKAIVTAGYEPVVIENVMDGEMLRTDVDAISKKITELGSENVACVLTTTSCFAPRAIDKVVEVGQVCKTHLVPHVINNAYGVQSTKCMHLINEAHRSGRVDAFVQSTDKNFMVPVGGSVVASSDPEFIKKVSQIYPGRASATPTMDVFITLLSLGSSGYRKLCAERKENFIYLKQKLEEIATRHGERVLATPQNPISIAVSLSNLPGHSGTHWTEFGSMLFTKCVSGTRVVAPGGEKTIGRHTFTNWGAHYDAYPTAYFTAAAAIGMRREEVDIFARKLDKTFTKFKGRTASTKEENESRE